MASVETLADFDDNTHVMKPYLTKIDCNAKETTKIVGSSQEEVEKRGVFILEQERE